jgi:hypothetical protein
MKSPGGFLLHLDAAVWPLLVRRDAEVAVNMAFVSLEASKIASHTLLIRAIPFDLGPKQPLAEPDALRLPRRKARTDSESLAKFQRGLLGICLEARSVCGEDAPA